MAILDILDFNAEMVLQSGNQPHRNWATYDSESNKTKIGKFSADGTFKHIKFENLEYLIHAFLSIFRTNHDILFATAPALGEKVTKLRLDHLLSQDLYP